MDFIFDSINNIKEDMEGFMASFEEISVSTEEITSAVEQMTKESEKTTELVEVLKRTTRKLGSIKNRIHESDGNLLENNKKGFIKIRDLGANISDNELRNILIDAKQQHESWMMSLRNAVSNKQILPLQVNSTRCGFGHFYQSLEVNDDRIKGLWTEIDRHHEELHGLGQVVLTLIWEKDYNKAMEKYNGAEKASKEVFKIIDSIIGKLQLN